MTDILVGWEPSDIQVELAQPGDIKVEVARYNIDVAVTGPMGPKGEEGEGGPAGGGVTDHGALTGLSDPDHPIAAVQGLQAALDGKAPTSHAHALGDLPSTLATDAEVTAAIAVHAAAADPHPVYLTTTEGNAAYEAAGAVAAHVALADPHTAYLKPAEVLAGTNVTVDTVTTPGSVIINSNAGGGGSTILSGTATPTGAVGAVGDYYLDTDGNILYGPKASATSQSLYGSQTGSWFTEPTALTFGSEITCAVAGAISALRFNKSDTSFPRTHTMRLWKADGTQLGSADTPDESGTGWMTATLATPVAVTAGQKVRVSIDFPGGSGPTRYGTSPLTNGALSLSTTNGWYAIGTNTYPSVSDASGNMMLDVVWSGASWPVALSGGGSTILSGTATPTGAVGAVGYYYLDTDANILYGPKADTGSYSGASVHTTQVPANSTWGSLERGARITCAEAGYITGLRWYRGDYSPNSRTMKLWNIGGSLLSQVVTSSETGLGWKTANLNTPVAVTAGQQVVVSWDTSSSEDPSNTGGLSSPIVNGPLTATTGVSNSTPGSYPNTPQTTDYFADVVFSSTLAAPWPVAVQGVVKGTTPPTDLNAIWLDLT